MLDTGSHQECDRRSAKSRKRGGESKGARAALGWILFRQPECIDGKIRTAESEKEKANEKPRKRSAPKVENFPKRQADEGQHQRKIKCQCAAPAKFFREPGHRQASKNGREGNEHGSARSELGSLRANAAGCFRKRRDRRRDIHGASP